MFIVKQKLANDMSVQNIKSLIVILVVKTKS